MAIDRQDCVLRPFHRRITPQNVKTVLLTSWLVTLGFTTVFAFSETFTTDSMCRNFDPYALLGKLSTGNSFGISLCRGCHVLKCDYFCDHCGKFSSHRNKDACFSSANRIYSKLQGTQHNQTYFRSCAAYIICFLPFFICNLLVRFGGFYGAEINSARVLTVTIAKFTYVLNPFLHDKLLKVPRPANNIFPMVFLHKDLRTHAGVSRPARSANDVIASVAVTYNKLIDEVSECMSHIHI